MRVSLASRSADTLTPFDALVGKKRLAPINTQRKFQTRNRKTWKAKINVGPNACRTKYIIPCDYRFLVLKVLGTVHSEGNRPSFHDTSSILRVEGEWKIGKDNANDEQKEGYNFFDNFSQLEFQ